METVAEIIRRAETNYISGTAKIGNYVDFSMHLTIEKILAYVNSKFTSSGGDTDSLGREKPFFNIVTAAVNVWYRATDIDRKDIVVSPDKTGNIIGSFLATLKLKEWMKKEKFGIYLNKWGRTLATYGSAVTKTVEKDGKLIMEVIPWNRMICDPQNFDALPRIEKLYLTSSDLRKNDLYDQDVVEKLINAKTTRKNIDKQNQDNLSEFIEVYEVHGELSQELYNSTKGLPIKDNDKNIFFQQMHVVAYHSTGKSNKGKKEYQDFVLYCGKEKEDPYDKDDLIEEDGRTLGIGAVEHLFEAQWMVNHSIKQIKDTLDISSKLIFQTSDKNFINKNILKEIETGDILYHEFNKPLTQVNDSKGDIASLENFINQWKILSQEITSSPDAIRGNTLPSGTPYSLGAYLGQQAGSLFEIMIENKALALEQKLRKRIIPFLKTKLNTDKEIMATLEGHELKKIDAIYIPNKAIRDYNKKTIEDILNLKPVSPYNQLQAEQQVKNSLSVLGNKRSFKPTIEKDGKEVSVNWSEVLKDLEWELDINISGEVKDKQALLTTLSTTFQTIVGLAGRPMTEDERLIFNRILSETGAISPVELSLVNSSQQNTNVIPDIQNAGVLKTTGRTPVVVK